MRKLTLFIDSLNLMKELKLTMRLFQRGHTLHQKVLTVIIVTKQLKQGSRGFY